MDAFAEQFLKLSQQFATLEADQRSQMAELKMQVELLKQEKTLLETQNYILTARVGCFQRFYRKFNICELEEDCDMPHCRLLHPPGWRHETPAPEVPVPAPAPEPPAPEAPAPAPALFKNRNFQKFCAKLDLPDGTVFRTVQNGFTCQFTLHKTPEGYEFRSQPFGTSEIELNIREKAPSTAVQRFRESLKGLNLAYQTRKRLDADGWEHMEMCVEGEEGDEWHMIGEDCWGISWNKTTGEWDE